ncbi:MAG: DUF86 domain-containing protein [Phycisphaerales bacterium JB063]
MPRDASIRFADMLEFSTKAHEKAAAAGKERFIEDEDLQVVVSHWILLLGEAAARIEAEDRAKHPALPWKQMLGMRNRIVHEYFAIDAEIVWKTAIDSLPQLIEQLRLVLAFDHGDASNNHPNKPHQDGDIP